MSPISSKLPTASEVISTSESKALYRSNLLRLQIEELLSSITPAYDKLPKVHDLVSVVSRAIADVKPLKISVEDARQYPSVVLHKDLLQPLSFTPPSTICDLGSFQLKSLVKPLHTIDLGFVIPSSCFSEKDFKSHRYFDRKNIYCAEICKQLSQCLPEYTFNMTSWYGDSLKQVIIVSVPNSSWSLHLIPCISPDLFPASKLDPDYKNVAESTVCDPLYNAAILEDMHVSQDRFLGTNISQFSRAVELVKVWLYRRRLLITSSNHIGLSGYHIRALLCHICQSQSLPRDVSVYQLFKLFVALIGKVDWTKQSIKFGSSSVTTGPNLPYPVLQLSDGYNALWRVPLCVMEELAAEASDSLSILDDPEIMDPFESLFCPLARPTDFTISIPADSVEVRTTIDELCRDVKRGLGNRLFRSIFRARAYENTIQVSGDIDASTAMILIEKGPSADSKEAGLFRSFWSTRAELRRFKDGSILECTVWEKSSPVADQILKHILASRFAHLRNFEISLCPLGACNPANSSHVELWSSFEALRSKLVAVGNLPISIVDFRPSHGRFTQSDLVDGSGTLQPLDCVIEFESSKNWPNSKLAIWHSKVAFLLAIREGLTSSGNVQIAAQDTSEEPFMDVKIAGQKFAFRVRIFASIELSILNNQIVSVDNPPSVVDIDRVSTLYYSPMLRRRVHALSTECPAISGACRIAKEWLDNHLLISPWLDCFVEQTMSFVATSSPEKTRAQSPHTLFLSWLFFIANHCYKTTPLFMRWSSDEAIDDLTVSLRERYEAAVEGRRSWWISSDIDPDCLFMRRPDEWESLRIQSLAKNALGFAENAQWDLIKQGSDNGAVYDVLMEIAEGIDMDSLVKVFSEQFRKYFSFHYSRRLGLVGIVFESSSFRPQSNNVVKSSSMMAVVDETAVPDFGALMSKLSTIVGSKSVISIKTRR